MVHPKEALNDTLPNGATVSEINLLCLAHLPVENQSARQRLVQYFPYLGNRGIRPTFWPSIPSRLHDIKNTYGPFNTARKATLLSKALLRRLTVELPQFGRFDALLVHREVFPFFTPFFEEIAHKLNPRFILDFDDAVYVEPTHYRDWRSVLRKPENFARVAEKAAHITAGSRVLFDYAKQYNDRVSLLPTVVDTDIYPVKKVFDRYPVVIGWIGAWATTPSLKRLTPVLSRLASTENFRLKIVGSSNIFEIKVPGVEVEYRLWSMDTMMADLADFDIGLMPLPDTPWERGKCGGKLIQYMALGIPALASPVGANTDIVTDGTDGYLPDENEEWEARLRELIRNPTTRRRVGKLARKTVEDRFSVRVTAPQMAEIIEAVVRGPRAC